MYELIEYLTNTPIALYLCIGILSLCIGSFLNVVIYRLPLILEQEWTEECHAYLHPEQTPPEQKKLSLSFPPSNCPSCHSPIRWYQNIPLISWLCLKGKCANCQNKISLRYPLIELLTVVCSLAVVYIFGASLQMVFALIFTWILIALTFIDFDTQLLPDRLTFPLAGLGLVVNAYAIFVTPRSAILGYVIGFLCLWIVYYLFKVLTKKEGMGYGDFKLLAALGAWTGPLMLPLIVLVSSLFGAIIGIILLKRKKQNQPFAFGPYLAIAGWISLLWGDQIMKMYLGY